MLQFKIEKESRNPKSTFVVEVEFMHGDADNYSTKEYPAGIDINSVIPIVEFFERCKAYSSKGMRGSDGYWSVEGYEEGFEIPRDSPYVDGHANVEDITVLWYNSFGTPFVVTYVKE